jgi:prolyl-tRNA synthetase
MNNIEKVVREELNKISALEIGLNQLQGAEVWKQTGRYQDYGAEMFKLKDRSDKEMVFTGTNEELVTVVARDYVKSYRDLSFTFYQINNKFRDEIRCNTGLIRCKEFLMMDAYSFHVSKEDLEARYNEMKNCYIAIFNRLRLKYRIESADSGEIGGSVSEEFIVETSDGDIEIGHIFQLDTKYSSKLDAKYIDAEGNKQDIVMGCYGIGISRLAQVLADVNREGNNLNWNGDISAYKYVIVVADTRNEEQMKVATDMYKEISSQHSVYLDDRTIRIGEKLAEADLLGITNKILIAKNINEKEYERKFRSDSSWEKISMRNSWFI